MTGITFFGTRALEAVVDFYRDRLGAAVWLDQPDCRVLKYDNQLLGFCDRDVAETAGTLTFVVEDRGAVDALYEEMARVRATHRRAASEAEERSLLIPPDN